jgi:serine/threonine-protein kinase
MSDIPSNPVAPQSSANRVPETATPAVEATGSQPVPASGGTGAVTVGDSPGSDTDGPRQIGDFRVVQKIGEGGMGAVYLAEDPKLARQVAIKTMRVELAANKTNRDRFEREA